MFLYYYRLDQPDVTGSPLPASTTTASSSSVGMIVGLVIGGITIIVIGVLLILWAVCRRRKRAAPAVVSAFDTSQSVVVPLFWNHVPPVRPAPTGPAPAPSASNSPYLPLPVHSMTNLLPTSHVAPGSSGFSPNEPGAFPITDATDMISHFPTTSPSGQTTLVATSRPTGKATAVLTELVMAPPGQRARLNPPPYSALTEPGLSESATTRVGPSRKQMKRRKNVSGATMGSGNSRPSTMESAMTLHAGVCAEQGRPDAGLPGTAMAKVVKSSASGNGEGGINGGGNEERM